MPTAGHAGHHITYEDQGRPAAATDPHHDTSTGGDRPFTPEPES